MAVQWPAGEVTMADAIRWLRISYWAGAVVDAAAAVQMLYPPLFGLGMGLSGFEPGADYRYAMGMGASLMFGWTALLVWADRKPMERKGVLPLTILPVITGLAANQARGVMVGFLPVLAVLPIWALQVGLSAVFLWSYRKATRAEGVTAAATGT
jgi:hypothetical protein